MLSVSQFYSEYVQWKWFVLIIRCRHMTWLFCTIEFHVAKHAIDGKRWRRKAEANVKVKIQLIVLIRWFMYSCENIWRKRGHFFVLNLWKSLLWEVFIWFWLEFLFIDAKMKSKKNKHVWKLHWFKTNIHTVNHWLICLLETKQKMHGKSVKAEFDHWFSI